MSHPNRFHITRGYYWHQYHPAFWLVAVLVLYFYDFWLGYIAMGFLVTYSIKTNDGEQGGW